MKNHVSNFSPDFFIVGAQKAGTSTLHAWLDASPEVSLPWSKETHYFRDEKLFSRGSQWYKKQFKKAGDIKVIGEIDPEYMFFPECAKRIMMYSRTPKLIFVLREPLSRSYSHYLMSVRRGYETLDFNEALRVEKDRLLGDRFSQIHHSYLSRSLYVNQIERMCDMFPESEILFLLFEDLFSSQQKSLDTFKLLCSFIGVSHSGIPIDVSNKINQACIPRSSFIRDFIYKPNTLKKLIGKKIPSRNIKISLMSLLDRINSKELASISRDNELVRDVLPNIHELFLKDLSKLKDIGMVDVSSWIKYHQNSLSRKLR